MITYAQERLVAAMDDMRTMVPEQYKHTGDPTLPLDPNWQVYSTLETRGAAALFIARDASRPVGYSTALLHPHMNSKQVLVGTISTYYVEECQMRGLIMRQLLRTACDWLTEKGAQRVYAETEYNHSAGNLLERMGFTPVKIGYMMPTSGAEAETLQ